MDNVDSWYLVFFIAFLVPKILELVCILKYVVVHFEEKIGVGIGIIDKFGASIALLGGRVKTMTTIWIPKCYLKKIQHQIWVRLIQLMLNEDE